MGRSLLIAIIAGTAFQTLRKPFVGAMAYYCLAIWGPQYIWFWNFEGLRVSFITALSAMVALVVTSFSRGVNVSLLKNRVVFCIFLIWVSYVISYLFAPYVDAMGATPWRILIQQSKIILFFYISILLVDDLDKQRYFSYIMIAALIHLTFWANDQYLSQNWRAFNMGRLMGPDAPNAVSIYKDENKFAMFFVTGVPFLFYWGLHLAKHYLRYLAWLFVPFVWHAVFLTGSRGGLVGLAATVFAGVFFSRQRLKFTMILIPVFLLAFYFQAGNLLKNRTDTIVDYGGESSAEARLQSWDAAIGMMNAHPFTGVGPECFIKAMADFSPFQPRATHSTPLQFAAEIGVLSLCAYCWIIWQVLWNGLQNHRLLNQYGGIFNESEMSTLRYLNDSGTVSFFGLAVCSLFLSLNYYEIFYFLLIINGFTTYHVRRKIMGSVKN